jgi:hypothetical protein
MLGIEPVEVARPHRSIFLGAGVEKPAGNSYKGYEQS